MLVYWCCSIREHSAYFAKRVFVDLAKSRVSELRENRNSDPQRMATIPTLDYWMPLCAMKMSFDRSRTMRVWTLVAQSTASDERCRIIAVQRCRETMDAGI